MTQTPEDKLNAYLKRLTKQFEIDIGQSLQSSIDGSWRTRIERQPRTKPSESGVPSWFDIKDREFEITILFHDKSQGTYVRKLMCQSRSDPTPLIM